MKGSQPAAMARLMAVPVVEGPSSRAGQCRKLPPPPRGETGRIATIFRWTDRSPQDLAPRRNPPHGLAMAGVLHQVAPASSGLSLGRSRWMELACQRSPALSIALCE